MSTSESFRESTRAWLEANCPEAMRRPYQTDKDLCWGGRQFRFQSEDQERWLKAMASKGWTVPDWPRDYGGGGLTPDESKILKQELRRIKARPALESFGISMLGPALLKFGSEDQKRQFLPPIARGEIRWCQGYSEPNAGSDLASLATRAVDQGDHWEVTGSKVWTSYADKADWMFCLVRTSTEGRKQEGISFIVFDMKSEGVSTSPIRLISGSSPFCETHLDQVNVPKSQTIGEVNTGWTIAKYLLTHEREMISAAADAWLNEASLAEEAEKLSALPASLRNDIIQFDIDDAAFRLTLARARDEVKAGISLGAVASLFKYYGTELNKRRFELKMAIAGANGLIIDPQSQQGNLGASWLRTKGNSIEGGTTEIQLNIVAKHLLRLP